MPAVWTVVFVAADWVTHCADITVALFVRLTTTVWLPDGMLAAMPRWKTVTQPTSPALSIASPPLTAGTLTPPYVTLETSGVAAAVHTATVTPLAVPPGVWLHEKDPSDVDPVVAPWASDAPMWETAI